MLHWLVVRRTLTLAVSCALNVGMIVGLLFAFTHRTPMLPVELVMLEEAPAPEPPPQQKTLLQKLKLPRLLRAPKPIETPLPQTARTVTEPPAPAPTIAPPPGELPSIQPARPDSTDSAPAVRFAGPPSGAPPASAAVGREVASASATVTQYARPQGGYQVRPAYPASARRLGVQGTTLLKVHVLVDGAVGEIVVQESAGHADLDQAASDAVRRWRFDPARRGSEPVAMWVLLPVEFRLR